jgi:hypothetical protein
MDNDRAFKGRLRDQTAYPFAAIVVLALAGIIGLGLATGEGVEVAPAASLASRAAASSRATASSLATPKPTIALAPTLQPSLFHGLIGLPPETAEPSAPETGELVESYSSAGGGPPYRGTARLYADGRLIWNRYFSGPGGPNSLTTGYLEQRLTPEGISLVKGERDLLKKVPLVLLESLPLDAWEARWPVPYVPTVYGICLDAQDPRPGQAHDGVTEPAHLIEMLPASVSSLLAGREYVSPIEWDQDCIALSLEETRALERVLRDGDYDQDAFTNNFMVQYLVDVPGAYGMQISLMFEPRFPDGSIGCSACG